ncbi:hypothetical protein HY490_02850 [Candidatus Woesearchaeota archaeon]|nr:hypothetical protein [Candidatus Woesearchaeota archaeon]
MNLETMTTETQLKQINTEIKSIYKAMVQPLKVEKYDAPVQGDDRLDAMPTFLKAPFTVLKFVNDILLPPQKTYAVGDEAPLTSTPTENSVAILPDRRVSGDPAQFRQLMLLFPEGIGVCNGGVYGQRPANQYHKAQTYIAVDPTLKDKLYSCIREREHLLAERRQQSQWLP